MSSPQNPDVLDARAIFSTLWRGKLWIAFAAITAVLLGGYYAFVVATPIFRSTAVVILEADQRELLDLQSIVGGLSGDSSEINSEVEVIRARSLIGRVVDQLDLVDDPEFNQNLQPESRFAKIKQKIERYLGLTADEITLSDEMIAIQTRDAVITNVLDAISVQIVPSTLVFHVTVESESGRKSAMIADTLVELYVLDQIEVKFNAMEEATVWLSERVADLQVSLESAENELATFSASADLISLESLEALERQMKSMRDRILIAESEYEQLGSKVAAIRAAESNDRIADLANDSQLRAILARQLDTSTRNELFDARLDVVLAQLNRTLSRAEQQLAALRSSEASLVAELEQQGEDLIVLRQLTREAEASRILYEYFLTRLNETSALQGVQQADSRILSKAVISAQPSEPRKSIILILSAFLGLAFGAVYVTWREARKSGFRTGRELQTATGIAVLGQIPLIPVRSRKKLIKYLAEKPMSAAAEAYRNLRTSLIMVDASRSAKVIVVCSSVPGEGKTTNALGLAQNFAGLGKHVLFIEGDMRRRTIGEYFDSMPKQGLVAVMNGEKNLSEATFRPPSFGVDILPGEGGSKNAADLYASDAFEALIATARASYDIVIVDTPPILLVPDARVIARLADQIVFVVQWDKTAVSQVQDSLQAFSTVGQEIAGLVLSKIDPKGMRRYGLGASYGAYGNRNSKYFVN